MASVSRAAARRRLLWHTDPRQLAESIGHTNDRNGCSDSYLLSGDTHEARTRPYLFYVRFHRQEDL